MAGIAEAHGARASQNLVEVAEAEPGCVAGVGRTHAGGNVVEGA